MRNELPTLAELENFFGHPPTSVVPEEGLMVFRLSTAQVSLVVSISEVSRSFQTSLHLADGAISTVVFEGLEELSLLGDQAGRLLRANFRAGEAEIKCVVRVRPKIQIEWSGITS